MSEEMSLIDRSGCLLWQENGPIGILSISNKPSNMIPRPDFADLNVVKTWIENKRIKGVILKGDGRHFSAGADLSYFNENSISFEDHIEQFNKGKAVLNYIENLEKPVLASIDGICLGGGLEVALAAHIRYCSENAVFGFPEINHGIVPGFDGIERSIKTVGRSNALQMLLTGDTYNVQFAYDIGLVSHIVCEKSSFNYTIEVMKKIIEKGEKPVAYAIRSVNSSSNMLLDDAVDDEARMFAELVISQYGGGESTNAK